MTEGTRHIVMAGGGTGGHVYPGIALAAELQRLQPETRISWVGTEDRVESWAVPAAGYPIAYLPVTFLKGRRGLALLKALFGLPVALWRAFRLVGKLKPDAVVGLGGFVSGPLCLAAALRGRKVFLLEQNARPGITNRLNARVSRTIFATFEASREHFPAAKVQVAGNPIRPALLEAFTQPRGEDRSHEARRILVFGGSQGSLTLNETIPVSLRHVHDAGVDIEVRHASGKGRIAELDAGYQDATFPVERLEYIEDMAEAYRWADLVICRAGATTISELTAVGLPALYVPFPYAADDHQAANAKEIVEAGGGWMLRDEELREGKAATLLADVLRDPDLLRRAGLAAKERGRPQAGADIARTILASLEG